MLETAHHYYDRQRTALTGGNFLSAYVWDAESFGIRSERSHLKGTAYFGALLYGIVLRLSGMALFGTPRLLECGLLDHCDVRHLCVDLGLATLYSAFDVESSNFGHHAVVEYDSDLGGLLYNGLYSDDCAVFQYVICSVGVAVCGS